MSRTRRFWNAGIGLVVVTSLLLGACGPATVAGPEIPEQDPVLVAEGATLYQASCAECHGEDLRGTDKGPSHLSIVYEPNHHSDTAFVLAILTGSQQHHWPYGPMEPVEGLSDHQIAAIIAFVRESQRINGFEAYPPT